jgi:putative phage-type endonuclease
VKRNIIQYDSHDTWLRLRKRNINSTESSGLLGLNKYTSLYQIYQDKHSPDIISIEENERMFWGNQLEWVIAQGAAKKMGWNIIQKKDYIEIPEQKLGGSFDCISECGSFLVEVKNVDSVIFKNEWTDTEAPAHVEMQLQHQMLVSGVNHCKLVALVGGNKLVIIERDADPEIQDAIIQAAKDFWAMTEAPTPDFIKDAEYIKQLYNKTDGTVIESDALYELCVKRDGYAKMESEAKKEKDACTAEILTLIGPAAKVIGSRYTINAGVVNKKEYTVAANSYRSVRVTVK